MTTASLASAANRSTGLVGAVFARAWLEIVAFFEEAHAANVRTGKTEPFGL
ncbi:hypothetical protein [Methylopila turkensis]|uniref:Uncharacterized protein n=1 Tax=Methylopila turkensis TaxID=1437816 RepID=A0A9W6JPF0_9HYPH|nr:hypothetical protein [Methylopila turkensis]GLK80897.1 hypothetical protein GCM10008174_26380 [Methylopila turkensis]